MKKQKLFYRTILLEQNLYRLYRNPYEMSTKSKFYIAQMNSFKWKLIPISIRTYLVLTDFFRTFLIEINTV